MSATEKSLLNGIAFIRMLIKNYQLPEDECLTQMKTFFPRLAASYLEEYPEVQSSATKVNSPEEKPLYSEFKKTKKKLIKQMSTDSDTAPPETKTQSLLAPYVKEQTKTKEIQLEIDSEPEQDPPKQLSDESNDNNDSSDENNSKQNPQKQNALQAKKKQKKAKKKSPVAPPAKPNIHVDLQDGINQSTEHPTPDFLTEEKGFAPCGISGIKPLVGFHMFGQKKKFRVWSKSKLGEGEFSSLSSPLKVKSFGNIRNFRSSRCFELSRC